MVVAEIPAYTLEEQQLAIASMLRLNNPLINAFLAHHGLKKGNNKAQLQLRITDALEAEVISYADIYKYLHPIESWGRQHIVLFDGPAKNLEEWSDPQWVIAHIENQKLSHLLNIDTPLALPKDLTLSSIKYSNSVLRITAVERREGEVRDPESDYSTETFFPGSAKTDGHVDQPTDPSQTEDIQSQLTIDESIIYRAYRYRIYRGIISFEWDVAANHAFLQISQLPSGEKYEDAITRFDILVSNIIKLGDYSPLCLRSVIARLHELEELRKPEARSQGIAYKTVQGRTIEGKSAAGTLNLLGESVVDTTMSTVRKVSVGHTGNFYWLPPDVNIQDSQNPLTQELHVYLNGDAQRCNFPVLTPESHTRYVLQRIRAIAAGTP
jgi:hypothetical protein